MNDYRLIKVSKPIPMKAEELLDQTHYRFDLLDKILAYGAFEARQKQMSAIKAMVAQILDLEFENDDHFFDYLKQRITVLKFEGDLHRHDLYLDYRSNDEKGKYLFSFSDEINIVHNNDKAFFSSERIFFSIG